MNRLVAAACLLPLAACQAAVSRLRGLGPLETEGEVYLYLEPYPRGSERLAFALESSAAVASNGAVVPLELSLAEVSASSAPSQRLLAWGRLPPGAYGGFLLKVRRATLESEGAVSDLLVPAEPARVDAAFAVVRRKATLLWLWFRPEDSVRKGFAFAPVFSAGVPEAPLSDLVGYCSNTGWDNLTVFDKRARKVVGVLPTGRGPAGIAMDPARRRAYVALSEEDQVAVLDVQSGEEIARIPLRPGDGPQELGLTPDGRLLLAVNARSGTAAFLDPAAAMELSRVRTGDEPASLVIDRSGRRAYVLNRRSATLTVLDLANRAVVTTAGTDPEPLRARLDRTGTRLYLVAAGSPYLTVFSLPDLSVWKRVLVGLGAGALEVDPRTDFVYVGGRDEDQLRVFDPASLLPMRRFELPGPAALTAIDDANDVIFSVVPSRRLVGANDLVSSRSLSPIEVGEDPYQVALAGERR
jgi:DNA-binding beta-propeller fold protein YncE